MSLSTLNGEIYEASSLADASGYIATLCFLHEEAMNNSRRVEPGRSLTVAVRS